MSLRLRYQVDAAHLMRQSAPETSAWLMRQRAELLSGISSAASPAAESLETLLQSDAQREHTCTACGHIMIPGRDGTTLTIQPGRRTGKKRRRQKQQRKDGEGNDTAATATTSSPRIQKPHAGIAKVYVCGLCGGKTKIALPPPPPLSKQRRATRTVDKAVGSKPTAETTTAATKVAVAEMTSTTTAAPAAAAKATKAAANTSSKKRAKTRKAGLLALLDKSRESESSALGGLSLSFDDFRKK